jgi:phenylalanyl-tRNA synthetase alpha subunit
MSNNDYETAEKIGAINTRVANHEQRLQKIEGISPRIEKLETNDMLQEKQIIENQQAIKTVIEGMATKEDVQRIKTDVSDFKTEIKKEITLIKEDSSATRKWARNVFLGIPGSLALGLTVYGFMSSASNDRQQKSINEFNKFNDKRYELIHGYIQSVDKKLNKIEGHIISKGK